MGMTTDSATELQRDFKATIYWMKGNVLVPIRRSKTTDKFTWGVVPGDDWLQAGGDQPSLILDFEFHSKTEDRLHYMISRSSGFSRLGLSGQRGDRLLETRTVAARAQWLGLPLA